MYELDTTDIILSIIFTWVIGLLPPVLIRFAFLKRPIAKWPAIGISAFFLFCNMALFIALGSKSKTHAALWLIAWISYFVLRRENKNPSASPIQSKAEPSPPPTSAPNAAAISDHEISINSRLAELKALYEKGLVTNDVYQERQKEILRSN